MLETHQTKRSLFLITRRKEACLQQQIEHVPLWMMICKRSDLAEDPDFAPRLTV